MKKELEVGSKGTLPLEYEVKSFIDEKTKNEIVAVSLKIYCEVLDCYVTLVPKEKADGKIIRAIIKEQE